MPRAETLATLPTPAGDHDTHNWYWEGNVQSRLVTWLVQNGYHIRQVANTATREAGIDVIATTPANEDLLVSVKGFPERTEKTTSPTQARHWFSGAIFDLVLYRNDYPSAQLALALPEGFTTYATLTRRTQWLRESMPFTIFWIGETGDVRAE